MAAAILQPACPNLSTVPRRTRRAGRTNAYPTPFAHSSPPHQGLKQHSVRLVCCGMHANSLREQARLKREIATGLRQTARVLSLRQHRELFALHIDKLEADRRN
jgi:hypothetical protein